MPDLVRDPLYANWIFSDGNAQPRFLRFDLTNTGVIDMLFVFHSAQASPTGSPRLEVSFLMQWFGEKNSNGPVANGFVMPMQGNPGEVADFQMLSNVKQYSLHNILYGDAATKKLPVLVNDAFALKSVPASPWYPRLPVAITNTTSFHRFDSSFYAIRYANAGIKVYGKGTGRNPFAEFRAKHNVPEAKINGQRHVFPDLAHRWFNMRTSRCIFTADAPGARPLLVKSGNYANVANIAKGTEAMFLSYNSDKHLASIEDVTKQYLGDEPADWPVFPIVYDADNLQAAGTLKQPYAFAVGGKFVSVVMSKTFPIPSYARQLDQPSFVAMAETAGTTVRVLRLRNQMNVVPELDFRQPTAAGRQRLVDTLPMAGSPVYYQTPFTVWCTLLPNGAPSHTIATGG